MLETTAVYHIEHVLPPERPNIVHGIKTRECSNRIFSDRRLNFIVGHKISLDFKIHRRRTARRSYDPNPQADKNAQRLWYSCAAGYSIERDRPFDGLVRTNFLIQLRWSTEASRVQHYILELQCSDRGIQCGGGTFVHQAADSYLSG